MLGSLLSIFSITSTYFLHIISYVINSFHLLNDWTLTNDIVNSISVKVLVVLFSLVNLELKGFLSTIFCTGSKNQDKLSDFVI